MDPPPPTGDPYQMMPADVTNPGSVGVAVAWDTFRYFWGTVAGQGWDDLDTIANGGILI